MAHSKAHASPLDFSFKSLEDIECLKQLKPRYGLKKYQRTHNGRYDCTAVRLNNNHLVSVHGIHSVLSQLLEQPEHLTWLDLSFNRLTSVPPELSSFSELKIVYLHGNCLADMPAVLRPLKCLDELYSVTLHGNPLEEHKNYRTKVLAGLPQLKSLDFTNVTSADMKRVKARSVSSSNARKLKSNSKNNNSKNSSSNSNAPL